MFCFGIHYIKLSGKKTTPQSDYHCIIGDSTVPACWTACSNIKGNIKAPHYRTFVRGIHQWPAHYPHRGSLMWEGFYIMTPYCLLWNPVSSFQSPTRMAANIRVSNVLLKRGLPQRRYRGSMLWRISERKLDRFSLWNGKHKNNICGQKRVT